MVFFLFFCQFVFSQFFFSQKLKIHVVLLYFMSHGTKIDISRKIKVGFNLLKFGYPTLPIKPTFDISVSVRKYLSNLM